MKLEVLISAGMKHNLHHLHKQKGQSQKSNQTVVVSQAAYACTLIQQRWTDKVNGTADDAKGIGCRPSPCASGQ